MFDHVAFGVTDYAESRLPRTRGLTMPCSDPGHRAPAGFVTALGPGRRAWVGRPQNHTYAYASAEPR